MANQAQALVTLLWHMHQPDYRDPSRGGVFRQPWVYLHALKDYTDMATHLERHPRVRATFNFSGVLLDQLRDYENQCQTRNWRDPLIMALAQTTNQPFSSEQRAYLADQCLRLKRETMVRPYAGYARLEPVFERARLDGHRALVDLPDQRFRDLVIWYHLAWLGECVKRTHPTARRLLQKAENFSAQDRDDLVDLIVELLREVLPRYGALLARKQIEISMTPYGHPLAPLLIDFSGARELEPATQLPRAERYPGGLDRMRWHIREAVRICNDCFGASPKGLWPAEAAVCDDFIRLVAAEGFEWIASNEGVLSASTKATDAGIRSAVGRTYHLAGLDSPVIVFRNARISENFGFEYGKRKPESAVAHVMEEIAAARAGSSRGSALVNIILDGENAWEHYPANAYEFFEQLYAALASSPDLELRTISSATQAVAEPPASIRHLVPGSWVMGGFSLWIGDTYRNRAWDFLCEAKRAVDERLAQGNVTAEQRRQIELQLARCEASDWFWWLGFDEPVDPVIEFDRQFREHLALLYALIGTAPPLALTQPLSKIAQHSAGEIGTYEMAALMVAVQRMRFRCDFPEVSVEVVVGASAPDLDRLLQDWAVDGWAFLVPGLESDDQLSARVFKYSEVKIALEKSDLRFFEGSASFEDGKLLPGLFVAGISVETARAVSQRFQVPACVYGGIERPAAFLWGN
jgi:alpha-amylase/alpha-mannosidase (GH57 family)